MTPQKSPATFLLNAWYCVGFPEELTAEKMKSLTVLERPIVLFRNADGVAVALDDRCPHRFAPLSRGKLKSGIVQCGYHGLRFDATGRCVHNPHAGGAIPSAAKVGRYPLLEKHQALWVWLGDPDKADSALLPDFSVTEERPGWMRVQGSLHIKANYQLVTDNLLDLSHVQYLHSFLSSDAPPPPGFRPMIKSEQRGHTILAINELSSIWLSPLYQMLWERGEPPATCDMRANMRWDAPSTMYLDTGATVVDAPREVGPSLHQGHWLTPETATTTHYFWTAARDRYLTDEKVATELAKGIDAAFRYEDEPMIEAVQERMGFTGDLWALAPVLLATDGAPVRARRILEKLIAEETKSAAETA